VDVDTVGNPLETGRQAVSRRAWPEAYEALATADAAGDLHPADLELLAKAAWWTGHQNESIEARERAYTDYLDRGDKARAALMALTLRREHNSKLQDSVAKGWLNRAERLLRDEPESVAHGYLALALGGVAWNGGELEEALGDIERGVEISRRFDDADLQAWASMYRGMLLVDLGRVEEGWALLEDVSAAAVGGELGNYTTGGIFCNVISTCRDLADYRRAGEWADAAKRWCERQSINGFPGVCRVHRAEIMRLLGTWSEAETELRTACDELNEFSPAHAGAAFHELGEVRLRMGDLEGADEAFRRANEMGEDPQPGRTMLLLAQGKVDAAASSIRRSLEDQWSKLARARLLPMQAEVAKVAGDQATALGAAEELDQIAEEFGAEAIRASADWAHGLADLAGGRAGDAERRFRKARQRWREIDAPYEAARAGVALADAHEAEGDPEAARLELETSLAGFERLGAVPDAERTAARLAAKGAAAAGPAVATRTFVFTDIVGSTTLLEAIGDEAWTDLRRWHDDTLRTCVADHGGEDVNHTGDGFFFAFPDAASAVACAQEIQRRLAEHRRDHGFAPQVRIGMHAAEATMLGENYSGMGVHTAARVGAIAGGGEIVASASTVERLDGVDASDPREVSLKGIAEPVEIVSISWR
jgi:class 3 adenylate cyclase